MSGYLGSFAGCYDLFTQNVGYKKRAAYFDSIIRKYSDCADGILLDLACGTGSLAMEMDRLGYDVIGVDQSEYMLSVASGKAFEDQRNILFLRQKMEYLDLFGTVDNCICALDSLNHLSGKFALSQAIGRVSLFLNPGGLFVFDVNTAYKHREILANNTFVHDAKDIFLVWRNSLREDDGVEISLDFFEERADGGYHRSSENFIEMLFTPQTVEILLAEHGFDVIAVFGDDSFDQPKDTTQRLIYTTKKRGLV